MERPTRMNGGPSPRIRALASHDKLTRSKSAASFGVSKRSGRKGFPVERFSFV
jgi:hypothetical protein